MRLTMNPYSVFNARTARLLSFVEDALGDGAALQVVTMLQGLTNASAESGTALGQLAEIALAEPEVGRGCSRRALRRPRDDCLRLRTSTSSSSPICTSSAGARRPGARCTCRPGRKTRRRRSAWSAASSRTPRACPRSPSRRSRQQREEAVRDTEAKLAPESVERFRRPARRSGGARPDLREPGDVAAHFLRHRPHPACSFWAASWWTPAHVRDGR